MRLTSLFAIRTATGISLIFLADLPTISENLLMKSTMIASQLSVENPLVALISPWRTHSLRTEATLSGSMIIIIPSVYPKLRGLFSYSSLKRTSSGIS